ncbi:MAG: hypothetical protein N2595_09050, partial [bacterium]|nr:hypothetical protein [bacterium]
MKARMRIRAKIWWVGAWLLVLGGSGVGAPTVELELNSYITNWLILGPFPNRVVEGELGGTNRLGLFTDYLTEIGGEAEAKLARGVRVTGWGRVEATNITSVTPEIDLDGVYGMLDLGVGYAFVNVRVRREVEAYLHVGSDDGVRVWLDGKLVIDMPGERGYLADENWARVQLRRGRHRLLVKVDDAFGAWKFGLRFVDEAVHRELIARQIRKELRVELEGERREGEALRVRLDTEPSLTDFVARVVGRWVSGDGAITQGFVVGLGEFVELPKGYERAEKVRLEAWTEGIPGREVRRVVNIYGGPISVVASGLAVRAANVLEGLTRTDVTARLAPVSYTHLRAH